MKRGFIDVVNTYFQQLIDVRGGLLRTPVLRPAGRPADVKKAPGIFVEPLDSNPPPVSRASLS